MNWLHRLLHPHCPDCAHERECPSCDVLREQLNLANTEKQRLLDLILEKNRPEIPVPQLVPQPISKTNYMPWKVRQQLLEEEDRQKARILREKELEKEMGISDAPEHQSVERASS